MRRFFDIANDGWPDVFIANGPVYPEVGGKGLNNTFREFSLDSGAGITTPFNSHGVAAAEILVNNSHDRPSLLKRI